MRRQRTPPPHRPAALPRSRLPRTHPHQSISQPPSPPAALRNNGQAASPDPRGVMRFAGGETVALRRLHHYLWATDAVVRAPLSPSLSSTLSAPPPSPLSSPPAAHPLNSPSRPPFALPRAAQPPARRRTSTRATACSARTTAPSSAPGLPTGASARARCTPSWPATRRSTPPTRAPTGACGEAPQQQQPRPDILCLALCRSARSGCGGPGEKRTRLPWLPFFAHPPTHPPACTHTRTHTHPATGWSSSSSGATGSVSSSPASASASSGAAGSRGAGGGGAARGTTARWRTSSAGRRARGHAHSAAALRAALADDDVAGSCARFRSLRTG